MCVPAMMLSTLNLEYFGFVPGALKERYRNMDTNEMRKER